MAVAHDHVAVAHQEVNALDACFQADAQIEYLVPDGRRVRVAASRQPEWVTYRRHLPPVQFWRRADHRLKGLKMKASKGDVGDLLRSEDDLGPTWHCGCRTCSKCSWEFRREVWRNGLSAKRCRISGHDWLPSLEHARAPALKRRLIIRHLPPQFDLCPPGSIGLLIHRTGGFRRNRRRASAASWIAASLRFSVW